MKHVTSVDGSAELTAGSNGHQLPNLLNCITLLAETSCVKFHISQKICY
jgi:hypothetical protein